MDPARISSPSPPSPVPFEPPLVSDSSRSPTWDEYLANNNETGLVPYGDNLAEPRPTSYPSYTSTPAPIFRRKVLPSAFPMPPSPPFSVIRPAMKRAAKGGRWTKREHELFLEGLQRFGKSWKKISSLVHTRTLVQIRTHAQKYLQKQSRAAIKNDAKAAESQHQPRMAALSQMNAFPTSLSASASLQTSSTVQLNSVNRLDQLLQDDSALPAFVDEYYTSPTAIEDDLLRPLFNGEQWVQRLVPPGSYSNKRRRVETSTSTAVAVPTFQPLPAPDNLSSPRTSPQLAAVLLAAHESDETNVWL
ncbi:Myb domain [Phytophthora cactorum]|nr:Myb domain [Phytophthora cactorum]